MKTYDLRNYRDYFCFGKNDRYLIHYSCTDPYCYFIQYIIDSERRRVWFYEFYCNVYREMESNPDSSNSKTPYTTKEISKDQFLHYIAGNTEKSKYELVFDCHDRLFLDWYERMTLSRKEKWKERDRRRTTRRPIRYMRLSWWSLVQTTMKTSHLFMEAVFSPKYLKLQ